MATSSSKLDKGTSYVCSHCTKTVNGAEAVFPVTVSKSSVKCKKKYLEISYNIVYFHKHLPNGTVSRHTYFSCNHIGHMKCVLNAIRQADTSKCPRLNCGIEFNHYLSMSQILATKSTSSVGDKQYWTSKYFIKKGTIDLSGISSYLQKAIRDELVLSGNIIHQYKNMIIKNGKIKIMDLLNLPSFILKYSSSEEEKIILTEDQKNYIYSSLVTGNSYDYISLFIKHLSHKYEAKAEEKISLEDVEVQYKIFIEKTLKNERKKRKRNK